MRHFGKRNQAREWARVALKTGLLLTEPKVRGAIGDQLRERFDDVTETVTRKYEDVTDRLEAASHALGRRRSSHWPSYTFSFLAGLGVGTGVAVLLTPASGRQTREAIRARAVDVKNKASDLAGTAIGRIHPSWGVSSTGTHGD